MGLKARTRKWVALLVAVLFGIGFAAVLFLPYPERIGTEKDSYAVLWSDGSVTEESYASACALLAGISEEGDILFSRGTLKGTYAGGEDLRAARAVLEEGTLLPMLTMDLPLDRLERAALYDVYADMLYYDTDDWFAFNGEKVALCGIGKAETVFFTGGELRASVLSLTEAKTLIVGDDAELSYETLYGTSVRVRGKTRYIVENGAIVDSLLGGTLTAGEPLAADVFVPDVAVCAQGALLPCRGLVSLSLPFVGSGPVAAGEGFFGELGYLFSEGEAYFVPQTLKRVEVRGGALVSFAFYHCPSLEEIDACGVDPSDIERQAFDGLGSLRYLHTPRADVTLENAAKFTTYVAECGCTVYERRDRS